MEAAAAADLDFSAVAVEQAGWRCRGRCFIQGDALRKDFLNRFHYRTVFTFEMLKHGGDLALLARLQAGTRVIASVPNFDSFGHVQVLRDEAMVAGRYSGLLDGIASRRYRSQPPPFFLLTEQPPCALATKER